jgi:hypothetical protein
VGTVVVINARFLLVINFYFNYNAIFIVAILLVVVLVMVLADLLEVVGVPPMEAVSGDEYEVGRPSASSESNNLLDGTRERRRRQPEALASCAYDLSSAGVR